MPLKTLWTNILRETTARSKSTESLKERGRDMVSPETIYQYVWKDKRNGGKELYKHLRRRGRHNHKRGCLYKSRCIIGRVDIDERPVIVDERSRFGDLEIDTVIGANHKGAIMTINDMATGLLFMRLLSGKEAKPLADMAIDILSPLKHLLHTMTADNGKGFAEHKRIAENLGIDVYFAHPYHSWERGANENLNGLVRQYFPKGTDFSQISQDDVIRVQNILNNRPRKRLGFLTPLQMFKSLTNLEPNLLH